MCLNTNLNTINKNWSFVDSVHHAFWSPCVSINMHFLNHCNQGAIFPQLFCVCWKPKKRNVSVNLVLMAAGVSLPQGNESVRFFLLHNGSDTSDCGRSMDSACFSLLQVLSLYYGKPPTKGLAIITDKSLQINENVMVSLH